MKPVYMTRKDIQRMFGNVPTKNDMAVAVCSLPYIQVSGQPRYDIWSVGERLIEFCRMNASKNWGRHSVDSKRRTKSPMFFADRAIAWENKAVAVEKAMMRLKAEENGHETDECDAMI